MFFMATPLATGAAFYNSAVLIGSVRYLKD